MDDDRRKGVVLNSSTYVYPVRPRWREALGGNTTGDNLVVPSIFKCVRTKALSNRWDIVQIRPTRTPGRFVMWISIDGSLTPIPLRVPREFYLHHRTAPKGGRFNNELYSVEKVVRHLPRDAPCVNLYKVSVKEDIYLQGREHFIDLTNDPNVDGVYETKVSFFLS